MVCSPASRSRCVVSSAPLTFPLAMWWVTAPGCRWPVSVTLPPPQVKTPIHFLGRLLRIHSILIFAKKNGFEKQDFSFSTKKIPLLLDQASIYQPREGCLVRWGAFP